MKLSFSGFRAGISFCFCLLLLCGLRQTAAAHEPQSPAAPAPAQPSQEQNSSDSLESRLRALDEAVSKFKSLGVGVSPFIEAIKAARSELAAGDCSSASSRIKSIEASLHDQQKRFYANKIAVWHKQKEALISAARKEPAASQALQASNAASGLGKAAHGVLSREKTGYTPLIYPIAR